MLLRHFFSSFNFYRNGELLRNQIGRSGVQVKKENDIFTSLCSRSPQNLEFGHFTWLFWRGRQRNVLKFKTHVQSDCFCSLSLLFNLCGCRCRRRRSCLSSLLLFYIGRQRNVPKCIMHVQSQCLIC